MKRITLIIILTLAALSFGSCITIDDLRPEDPYGSSNEDPNNGSNQGIDKPTITDLTSSGEASNCYIVSSAGTYKFPPVKGNSNEPVGTIASVEVLWESFGTSVTPSVGDLINEVSYSNDYIQFSTPSTFMEGNAVIAAKNSSNEILWSWHIWLTDQPEEQVYANNAGIMMDRNLGATSATPGDVGALGLLYQWGRKDPFFNSSSVNNEVKVQSTGYWPSSVSSSASKGTIEYAVKNPMTFIGWNRNNYDWHYTGNDSIDATRWQDNVKTVYDPCPSGWRVPTKDVWAKADLSSGYYSPDDADNGILFGSKCSVPSAWYPISCFLLGDDGECMFFSESAYWSSTARGNDIYAMVANRSGVRPYSLEPPSYAYNVRCVQDSLSTMISQDNQYVFNNCDRGYYNYVDKILTLDLLTDGVHYESESYGYEGFGHRLVLEVYSSDGYLRKGIYTASSAGDIINEGEFRIGYTVEVEVNDFDYSYYAGTQFYDINNGETLYNHLVIDGMVSVNIEGDNIIIQLQSSKLNVSFIQDCSEFENTSGIPIYSYTNGSIANSTTANCYIISSSGTYTFDTVRGNSMDKIAGISSVEVLWESFGTDMPPIAGDLIQSVSYANGKITYIVSSPFKEGNAVIAAKSPDGTILWSWHIWLTDQPQEQVYYNNAGTMMDRNLGATSATPGDVGALGLLYQWGRKDPFLGSSSISSSVDAKSTGTWPSVVASSNNNGNVDYVTTNPMTFIVGTDSSDYDWHYPSANNALWKSFKTIYDPCPVGWRVPDGGDYGVWSIACGSSSSFDYPYDDSGEGMNFSGKFGDASIIWYPTSGGRLESDGTLYDIGSSGHYWSVTPDYDTAFDNVNHLSVSYLGFGLPWYYSNRSKGLSVRCLKE